MNDQVQKKRRKLRRKKKALEKESRHPEDALISTKATEQALLNATSDLAMITDTKGVILDISEAAALRVGIESNRLIGSCIYDFFQPEMIEFRKAYVNIVVQSRQMIRFEDRHEDMTFLVSINPVLNKENEVIKLAIFVSDTTELKKNEMLQHRFSQILATINDPIAYIDKDFLYQTVNEATLKIYQKKKREMIGHPMEEILGKKVFEKKFKPHIVKCLEGERIYHQDWFDFPDGQRRFMYMSYYPLFAKDKVVSGVVVNAVDVTKMKEMEEQLKLLSQTDQLTQLYNRVKFHDSLNREITRIRRYETDLSIIMFDIDHFKNINDTYGHDVGDEVLAGLAQLAEKCIWETDIVARWGGEEFMVLLPHTNLEGALILAERIRSRVEENPFKTVGSITCSFGVTQFVKTDDSETFTKRVDQALYEAKQKGRNRVVAAKAK